MWTSDRDNITITVYIELFKGDQRTHVVGISEKT